MGRGNPPFLAPPGGIREAASDPATDHRLFARRLTGRASCLDPRQVRRVDRYRRQPVRDDFPGPRSRQHHPLLADADRRIGGSHLLRKPQLAGPRTSGRRTVGDHYVSPRHREVPAPLGGGAIPTDRPMEGTRKRRTFPVTRGSRVFRRGPARRPCGSTGHRPVNAGAFPPMRSADACIRRRRAVRARLRYFAADSDWRCATADTFSAVGSIRERFDHGGVIAIQAVEIDRAGKSYRVNP